MKRITLMKRTALGCVVLALLQFSPTGHLTIAANRNAAETRPAEPAAAKGDELKALERELLGEWVGGPCVGNYRFHADGTYELRHFTPGGNTLAGRWSLRWNALPPTLLLNCTSSDFRAKDPTLTEYAYLNQALPVRLLELDERKLVLAFPADQTADGPAAHQETYHRRATE